ncbi:LamG-like jellyroll fold domain-containing protein [Parafilimonas sp.]|uniref:LamG-like jellyroll fold domain-containing protein n=1 Tax=Parafilimonas sp. TaxID=1969739 RepID=UPI0039E4206A
MKNTPNLITLILCLLCPFTSFSQVDLDKGLMAYYPFNGDANDASGNGNNPVFNNATLTSDYYGNANSAYHFNGVDTYIKIPSSNSLNFSNNKISLCASVRPTGFYTGKCYNNIIISKESEDYKPGNYSLRFSDAITGCSSNPTTAHEVFFGPDGGIGNQDAIQLNQWYNVVFTSDGDRVKLYVNCKLVVDEPAAQYAYTNPYNLFFGHLNNSSYPYWLNGDLDEVRIYNRALSEDEVKAYSFSCADEQPCNIAADFKYAQSACNPKSVHVSSAASNADSIWWNFGNGKTAGNVTDTTISYAGFGTYIVTLFAKTNTGCFDTTEYSINVNVINDSAVVNNDTSICAGASVQLMAINGLDYCWSPSAGLSNTSIQNPVASPLVTTTYHLHVLTDSSKPVIEDSVNITVMPAPAVNAGEDVSFCKGDSVQLAASGAIEYKWNESAYLSDTTIANPEASPLHTTSFVVRGYNEEGCFGTDTVQVVVLALPALTITNDTAVCTGGSVQLSASSTAGNKYSWSPSATLSDPGIYNPVATPDNETRYYVKVTNDADCASVDSVLVTVLPPPVISAMNDTSICLNDSVHLKTTSANANSFQWAPSSGLSNPVIRDPDASPKQSTLYTVTAGNGICSEKDSVMISVLSLPDIKAGNDTIVCGNASVQLNASGGVAYAWSPVTGLSNAAIADPLASVSNTIIYTVTGTGSNSCINKDSVTINVNPVPVFAITKDTAICNGDSVVLTASGGDAYRWSPADSVSDSLVATPTVHPGSNTSYEVIITNSVCRLTDTLNTVVIVNEKPDITIVKSNDIDCLNPEATLTATGGIQYTWAPPAFINNTQVYNPVVNPPADTWYFVSVVSQNNCTNTDSILVKSSFVAGSLPFQVPGAFTPNHDGVNDCFGLKSWGPVDYFDISIYDRWGYRVYHSNNINACWDGMVNGIPQGAGTFVYQIKVSSKCTEGTVLRKGTLVLIR